MIGITACIRNVQRRIQAIPTPCAWVYDALVRRGLARPERRIAVEIAGRVRSGTLLDLGSGPGQLALDIADRASELRVVGVDLSAEMVRLARMHARGTANAEFLRADAGALPLAGGSVDFIVSTGALHHFAEPAQVFAECRRVLKPGGEGRIYDGCPEAIEARAAELKAAHGRVGYWLAHKVAEMHGAPLQEYETRIAGALDRGGFARHYEMSFHDTWMEIAFRKPDRTDEEG
jgi:ubiquinone/menaquinone biosynthesis C-methylase UbiE